MTREQTINRAFKIANSLRGYRNYNRDGENSLWELIIDFNDAHDESEEIFMCEIDEFDDEKCYGVMIEDDPIVFLTKDEM